MYVFLKQKGQIDHMKTSFNLTDITICCYMVSYAIVSKIYLKKVWPADIQSIHKRHGDNLRETCEASSDRYYNMLLYSFICHSFKDLPEESVAC